MKRRLFLILVSGTVLYLCLCAGVYLGQNVMLYPGAYMTGSSVLRPPENVTVDSLELADGSRYRVAWGKPEGKPKGVLAFFVGNGEDLRSGIRWARSFSRYGLLTLVSEYPGYGQSQGSPGYDSLLEAADVSGRAAATRAKESGVPLFLGGISLGTFCAVHLAAQGMGQKLLLIAPLTSISEAGRQRFPFLPISWLNCNPFDNLAQADKIRCPTLVVHGDRDQVVATQMGRRMAAAIAGARLHIVEGQGHNSLNLAYGGPVSDVIERLFFE